MYVHKLFAVFFIFACVFLRANGHECAYDDRGLCLYSCPPDTYSYSPSCTQEAMPMRTCREPVARSIGVYCDLSRCDCREPKLWDEAAEKCVLQEDCSDQSKVDNDGRI